MHNAHVMSVHSNELMKRILSYFLPYYVTLWSLLP